MPRFTVLMAVYNHEAFVAQAIDSVLAQTCLDWELLVVDDGSTDGSGAILDALASTDPRIRVVHQTNAGAAASRNRAAGLAQGRWLTYLDSDDLWFPDALARYSAYLDDHRGARFIHGYYHRLVGERVTYLPPRSQDRAGGAADLFQHVFLSTLCSCHDRELFDLAGPFDTSLRCCEDYALFLRMSLHCSFEPIGHAIGLRRRHGNNISQRSGTSQRVEAEILRQFAELPAARPMLDPKKVARRLGTVYERAARQFCAERRYREAHDMAREAIARLPKVRAWRALILLGLSAALRRDPSPREAA